MSKQNRDNSFMFYQYVCKIIGSEEVVKTRRKIFFAMDAVSQTQDISYVSSGSIAEGLHLNGSDFDLMLVFKSIHVYENKNNILSFSNDTPIIVDISDTHPGFTKLKYYDVQKRYLPHAYVEIVDGEPYISSKLFREDFLTDDMIIHGPCKSSPNNNFDSVNCFWCREWIKPASRWITRSRELWPHYKLVKDIVKYGVLFVPIGCKGSVNEDMEWRLSFSLAEKQLIYSFSHTQLLCYALMKIILKDILKIKTGDLICSYFIKTIMFWLCEESDPSEWHPGNIIPCLEKCMRRLIYCVKYEICLHYFIPENNFFEGRFTIDQQKFLLVTLHEINNSFWVYLFHTDEFQNFRAEQLPSLSYYLEASALSGYTHPVNSILPYYCNNIKQTLVRLININDREHSMYILSGISKFWMQSPDHQTLTARNKCVYKQYQIRLNCFKAGLHSDAPSAWLLLASLFYKYNRFTECMDIINYTLPKYTSDKILLCFDNSLLEQTLFEKVKKAVGILPTCKHLLINTVKFTTPYYLLPVELTPLIHVHHSMCRIPPVVYLNLLSFLCYHYLGDERGKLNALNDLELTIRKSYFIFPSKIYDQMKNKYLKIAYDMILFSNQ